MQLTIAKLQECSKLPITSIYYGEGNWATVGYDHVLNVYEHSPQGEGDKWFYVVEYDNNTVEYIFNVTKVTKNSA